MSDIAISVENLGKPSPTRRPHAVRGQMYPPSPSNGLRRTSRIGAHQQRPQNLREALQRAARAPFEYLTTRVRQHRQFRTQSTTGGYRQQTHRHYLAGWEDID